MIKQSQKIFISWSGDRAKAVAAVLHDWLPTMFDQVHPWMSDVDIAAGSRGLSEIEQALTYTRFGIIVTTHANQHAPWLNFEAGALSQAMGNDVAFVAPLLVDLQREADLTGPLQQFQASMLNEVGVLRIVAAIALILEVEKSAWAPRFDALWSGLSQRLDVAAQTPQPEGASVARSQEDLLAEVLAHVRTLVRTADDPALPRRKPTIADDFETFINSIDWEVSSRSWMTDGERLSHASIGLRRPAKAHVVEAARRLIQERFGVDVTIELEDFGKYSAGPAELAGSADVADQGEANAEGGA